ncbi:MAG: glycosyltransferase family 2 protein [Edaphobacter sp.]
MVETRPLLTIAIPTYNRSKELELLLSVLAPQLTGHPEIELYISDNASPDDTPALVQRFEADGLFARYHRHPENIGPDANFVSCFRAARGKYFWLFSDDDIILPGTIDSLLSHITHSDFDIIYATSYGFRQDYLAERQHDPMGRNFHTITSARRMACVVNIMFTFVSGMIVNKERFDSIPHEDPSAFLSTNLVQLSWVLPLLLHHRRSLVLWNRPVAARQGAAGGYSLGVIFGEKLSSIVTRCLPGRPDLVGAITNFALRRWFPSVIFDLRASGNQNLHLEEADAVLRSCYGSNFRYWLFTWPVIKLPLSLARLWFKAGALISKAIYVLSVPGFWKKEI